MAKLRDLIEEEMPNDVGRLNVNNLAAISAAISLKRIADALDNIDGRLEEMKYKGE